MGFEAAVLDGGFRAWRARYPVEPIGEEGARDIPTSQSGHSLGLPSPLALPAVMAATGVRQALPHRVR